MLLFGVENLLRVGILKTSTEHPPVLTGKDLTSGRGYLLSAFFYTLQIKR